MTVSKLYKHYNKLNKYLKPLFYAEFTPNNIYQCYVIAAFSKSFEFNLLVNKNSDSKNSFFYTPSLRGICEDIITLQFLKKHKALDKDKLLQSYTMIQLVDMVETQTKFFSKNHKQQIIFDITDKETIRSDNTITLKEQWAKIGMNKDKLFPSVSHMAVDGGLVELYDYLYSATSDMVHFSPHNLMRNGWSKSDSPTTHYFSTENFSKYYSLFNEFYGGYLFVKFTTIFKKELKLSHNVVELIKILEGDLFSDSRWPELITFEEMNVPEAESIRLINSIRKLRDLGKKLNISDEEVEEGIKYFLKKIK